MSTTRHLPPGSQGAQAGASSLPEVRGAQATSLEGPPRRASHRHHLIPIAWVLLAATIGVQIAFPLTGGGTLPLTVASVVLLASASALHLAATRGFGAAVALVVIAGGGGLLAEAVGVSTGFPFGTYAYTDGLGLKVLGVPVLVPLAWIMMSWPALAVTRRLVGAMRLSGTRARVVTAFLGAYALTAWDVFLDPQMVDQGHWVWQFPDPSLPGVDDIPLTNFAGWLLVSFLMIAILDRVIGADDADAADDAVPVTAYLWTYFSSVMAHAVFFGRPTVALTGAVVMGVVAIPLLVLEVRALRSRRHGASV
ncbi:carotenoid biosynthesis protein [Gordonia alkanivorans]|uniref:carotenoid biosynthesis protein n=1 Tax=Gordonia sp. Swx-4 TaxID=3029399 RepID=UPI000A946AC2|nr:MULTISPECIES: carotenoid biosynthesis protein [Gordonia]MDH3005939.1 carotenoid biosynthesis protein [Gordonia alkanivorans]MDH3011257.1 carotenoid biosynthesis protein [Gordonia alkanivorans]MDH3015694.1 carotenoid biosynthesis protein [Gordonia alkanivorans]MDH3020856.1 carotenoid biosynthesis protein [Gordonia alkanivorans]MDH3026478.1 carotenoid biosynthesis protein [Gordonia alkanivorans]